MALNNVLGRRPGGGATVTSAAPAASSANSSAYGEFSAGIKDVTQGRVSLLMLNTLIVLLILFYLWTRSAQGGG